MRVFTIVRDDDKDKITEPLESKKQNYIPKSAKIKSRAIKLGSIIFAFIFYGALCSKFGLSVATLLVGGISCILLPIAIFAVRNKNLWEPFYNERILGIKLPEIEPEFTADFEFILMKDTLQLVVKNLIPHFFNAKFIRVKFDQVPNGVLYDVVKHTWSESKEYIELRLSETEGLAKAWDKKLRASILQGRSYKTEVLIYYQE